MSHIQNPKRRHHHVWQQYLKAWTTNGQIWCLQDSRVFPTGTPRIAVEKDFYKLRRLIPQDVALIKALFENTQPFAKRNHADLLNMVTQPFQIVEKFDPQQRATLDLVFDEYASTILEDYHAGIEASFIPALESALNGDVSFYDDDERCIPFLNYLCTQYMRTKGIKERAIELCGTNTNIDLSRVWNLLIHMFATNIGATLYVERKRRKLILIHNDTNQSEDDLS